MRLNLDTYFTKNHFINSRTRSPSIYTKETLSYTERSHIELNHRKNFEDLRKQIAFLRKHIDDKNINYLEDLNKQKNDFEKKLECFKIEKHLEIGNLNQRMIELENIASDERKASEDIRKQNLGLLEITCVLQNKIREMNSEITNLKDDNHKLEAQIKELIDLKHESETAYEKKTQEIIDKFQSSEND